MLKELLISVVSGVIVALVLQMFRLGGGGSSRSAAAPRQASYVRTPPPRSGGGGFIRFILAVAGGLAIAIAAAPFVLGVLHGGRDGQRGRFFDGGGPGRYGDTGYFDRGGDGIFGLPPLLVLTIICTIIVWAVLSAMRRR